MDISREEVKSLWSNIQHEEKLLQKKRRWLITLPTISSYTQEKSEKAKFLTNVSLLESFMREDDVSCEVVRASVERGFRAFMSKQEAVVQDYEQLFDVNRVNSDAVELSSILRVGSSMLDALNNNGLFQLAKIIAGNSTEFHKTRPRMKEFIKEYLQKVIKKSNRKECMELMMQLSQLFKDTNNLKQNNMTLKIPVSQSLLSAANKILERLDYTCPQTLEAMQRRLKGISVVPQMQSIWSRSGWNRRRLVKHVREACCITVSALREGNQFPENLAKAMAVAGLSLKLTGGHGDFHVPQFLHFSPEIETLQNDIIKAIQTLPRFKKPSKLKGLRCLLDPTDKIPLNRRAIKKLLVDYLFECSEIDIPQSLLGALAFINRNSQHRLRFVLPESMEDEIECILNLSSQLRQITWELLPNHSIDKEYADAYMDKYCGDDESSNYDTDIEGDRSKNANFSQSDCPKFDGSHSDEEVESVGDSRPVVSLLNTATNRSDSLQLVTAYKNPIHDMDLKSKPIAPRSPVHCFIHSPCQEGLTELCSQASTSGSQNSSKNKYTLVQDLCDEASLVAHQLIGRLLEKFLEREDMDLDTSARSYLRGGASIPEDLQDSEEIMICSKEDVGPALVRAVKELMPSFPESAIERVQEVMGYRSS